MDAADRRAVDKLTRKLAGMESRLARAEHGLRSMQLSGSSSIENDFLPIYDENGTERQRIGRQDDGTMAITYSEGPAPGRPSTPVVSARQLALVVGWDREMADGSPAPADLAQVDVHAAETPGFIPDGTTIVGSMAVTYKSTFTDVGRVLGFVADNLVHYVKLVAVSTSGAASEPSDEVAATPLPVSELEAGVIDGMEITGATLTGGLIRTAASGQRIELNGDGGWERSVRFLSMAGGVAEIRQNDINIGGGEVVSSISMASEPDPYTGDYGSINLAPRGVVITRDANTEIRVSDSAVSIDSAIGPFIDGHPIGMMLFDEYTAVGGEISIDFLSIDQSAAHLWLVVSGTRHEDTGFRDVLMRFNDDDGVEAYTAMLTRFYGHTNTPDNSIWDRSELVIGSIGSSQRGVFRATISDYTLPVAKSVEGSGISAEGYAAAGMMRFGAGGFWHKNDLIEKVSLFLPGGRTWAPDVHASLYGLNHR